MIYGGTDVISRGRRVLTCPALSPSSPTMKDRGEVILPPHTMTYDKQIAPTTPLPSDTL